MTCSGTSTAAGSKHTAIPDDRAAGGPFTALRDDSEAAVQGNHRGRRRRGTRGQPASSEDRRPLRQLHGRGCAWRRKGLSRPLAELAASPKLLDRTTWLARALGASSRRGAAVSRLAYVVNTDAGDPDRATCMYLARAAWACRTSRTTAKRSSPPIRCRPTASTSGRCSALAGVGRRGGRAGTGGGRWRPPWPRTTGTTSRCRDPQQDLQPEVRRAGAQLLPAVWPTWFDAAGIDAGEAGRAGGQQPGLLRTARPPCWPPSRWTTWQEWLAPARDQRGGAVPVRRRSWTRTSPSTAPRSAAPRELRDRWKRGVAVVEAALGEAVGQIYVARHFPPRATRRAWTTLVANLLEAYRRQHHRAGLDERGDQAARRWRSWTPSAPRSATRTSGSTTPPWRSTPADLLGNVERAPQRRRRPRTSTRSASPWTARSGS